MAENLHTDYVRYVIAENISTTIEGDIVDNETGVGVGGAGVSGEAHSDTIFVNAQADANGHFRIVLPGGENHTYVLKISAIGYDNRTLTGTVESGERKYLRIPINYNPFDLALSENSGALERGWTPYLLSQTYQYRMNTDFEGQRNNVAMLGGYTLWTGQYTNNPNYYERKLVTDGWFCVDAGSTFIDYNSSVSPVYTSQFYQTYTAPNGSQIALDPILRNISYRPNLIRAESHYESYFAGAYVGNGRYEIWRRPDSYYMHFHSRSDLGPGVTIPRQNFTITDNEYLSLSSVPYYKNNGSFVRTDTTDYSLAPWENCQTTVAATPRNGYTDDVKLEAIALDLAGYDADVYENRVVDYVPVIENYTIKIDVYYWFNALPSGFWGYRYSYFLTLSPTEATNYWIGKEWYPSGWEKHVVADKTPNYILKPVYDWVFVERRRVSVSDYESPPANLQYRNVSPLYVYSSSPGVDAILGSSTLRFSSPASTTLTLKPKDNTHGSSHPVVIRAYDSNNRLVVGSSHKPAPTYDLSLTTSSKPDPITKTWLLSSGTSYIQVGVQSMYTGTLSGASVTLRYSNGELFASGTTSSNGTVTFTPSPWPLNTNLTVTASYSGYYSPGGSATPSINTGEGGTKGATVQLSKGDFELATQQNGVGTAYPSGYLQVTQKALEDVRPAWLGTQYPYLPINGWLGGNVFVSGQPHNQIFWDAYSIPSAVDPSSTRTVEIRGTLFGIPMNTTVVERITLTGHAHAPTNYVRNGSICYTVNPLQ